VDIAFREAAVIGPGLLIKISLSGAARRPALLSRLALFSEDLDPC
jgi:hypothetical protein